MPDSDAPMTLRATVARVRAGDWAALRPSG